MKTVLIIFGTRPEAIKMCPLINEFKKNPNIKTMVCSTGQHKEMLDPILQVFNVVPDFNLNVMVPNQTLFDLTKNLLDKVSTLIKQNSIDYVFVHGDTTTAFTSALSAFYLNVPVCHIEAGLRTYNQFSPYPEEFNRQAVDSISSFYFAPTKLAFDNLIREGKNKNNVFITGNTGIDALKTTVHQNFMDDELKWASDSKLIILTAHRRESIENNSFIDIFKAIRDIIDKHKDYKLIYPVHLNPNVLNEANKYLNNHERIHLIKPLDVLKFHNYLNHAYFIVTDSGGIQEEAPSLGKPVLVIRDITERPEGVKAGTLKVIGTKYEDVYSSIEELITNENLYEKMSHSSNPYGDGHSSEKIVSIFTKLIK